MTKNILYKKLRRRKSIKKWFKPILVITLLLLVMNFFVKDNLPTFLHKGNQQKVIVIDPGHGGNDPGKVGVNDALEKEINLEIALKLKPYFEKQGFKVVMTRETDEGLYTQSAGNKKRSDLQARVKLANDCNPLLVVSIHQNSYQTKDCKGAQVFYYETSEEGKRLADYIQQSLIINVDSSNKREIKGNTNYFLLKEIKAPAVIVECGFLSNPEEADKLIQEEYQDKLAIAIHAGVTAYLKMSQQEALPDSPEGNLTNELQDKYLKEDLNPDESIKTKSKNDKREFNIPEGYELIPEI